MFRVDLSGADLSGADLSGAYLSRAYLSEADLSRAYLSRANLSGADLSRAYMFRVDLSGADLSGAYLSGVDLSGAYLSGAYLSRDIKITLQPIQVDALTYYVTIFDAHMQVGCEFHAISEWWSFTDERIAQMDGDRATQFWAKWKAPLQSICAAEARA
jgi:uncharacterized protein YjbI with pentapeptide repeats